MGNNLDFETFQKLAKEISTLTWNHSHILYGLVKWLQPKVIVEVGAWQGASSVWLARALQELKNGGKLYCIDDFSLPESFPELLKGHLISCCVDEMVTLVEGKSDEVMWPKQVDFAFIDGDHSFEGCKKDVEKAIGHGAKCIVVHDTTSWWGPRQFLEEFKETYGKKWGVIEVPFDEGLSIFLQHPDPKPPLKYRSGRGVFDCENPPVQ